MSSSQDWIEPIRQRNPHTESLYTPQRTILWSRIQGQYPLVLCSLVLSHWWRWLPSKPLHYNKRRMSSSRNHTSNTQPQDRIDSTPGNRHSWGMSDRQLFRCKRCWNSHKWNSFRWYRHSTLRYRFSSPPSDTVVSTSRKPIEDQKIDLFFGIMKLLLWRWSLQQLWSLGCKEYWRGIACKCLGKPGTGRHCRMIWWNH